MKRVNILSMLLAGIMLFVMNITIAGAQGPPSQPSSFYGTVKVNGANVPDGTEVTAWINGVQQESTTTFTDQANSVYVIAVANGNEDDTITFQVDGVEAELTGSWTLGGNVELNLTVTTDDPTLDAEFTCTPTSGQPPLEVSCTDESTGDITGWSWDFGDGTTSTDQNPTHTYTVTGTYSVALTVTGSDGSDSESKADYISLGEPTGGNVEIPIVSAGDLSVDWTGVTFPQTSIAGNDVLAYAITRTWTVSDTTNIGAGWHVTIVADDHLRGEQDPDNLVIEVGSTHDFKVACSDSEVAPALGANAAGGLPTCPIGAQAIPNADLGEAPLTMLTAAQYDGRGAYDFIPRFQLLVPGTTVIDVYRNNIFVDVIAGP